MNHNRIVNRAILSGDLKTVQKYIGVANPLDNEDYGGKLVPNKINYRNYGNQNMLGLALRPNQIWGDTPISDSQNTASHSKRSEYALQVTTLVLKRAASLGVLPELYNGLRRYDGIQVTIHGNIFDFILLHDYGGQVQERNDLYSSFDIHRQLYINSFSKDKFPLDESAIRKDSFTYQLLRLVSKYYPDAEPSETLKAYPILYKMVQFICIETKNPIDAQLAIAAPYQKRQPSIQNLMAQLPDVLREHIIYFLRSPMDIKRVIFPLIVRQLQLPLPIVHQALLQLEQMSPEDIDGPEDVIDRVVSLSPLSRSPLRLEYNPCPEDKELNPKTKRCVKKCKSDQVRNDKGRCVRKSSKKCPKGQVRDRITKECRDDRRRSKRVARSPKSQVPEYPVCVLFRVALYDEKEDEEKVNASQLSPSAKEALVHAIHTQFAQDVNMADYILTHTNIQFLHSDMIRMTGIVQLDPEKSRYGKSFNQWVQFINDNTVHQYKYGPLKSLFLQSNGKNIFIKHVYPCR
jgi:hypothetical protein